MKPYDDSFNEELEQSNKEILDDIPKIDPSSIVVYSRDWTVETINSQIAAGNIDLNPQFQRRNAWNDEKRSKLIESLVIGYPIPEIVLAEHPSKKKSFIVIDGKQRLLTIAGFINPDKYSYWTRDKLIKLKVRSDLIDLSFSELATDPKYVDDHRAFINSDLRCTVISGFSDSNILYDIFYRLNAGSVPLSSQELRQVLNRGPFANYLIETTNTTQPIHDVLGLEEPDRRLKDAEIILRLISFGFFPEEYAGNLQVFLSKTMDRLNLNWSAFEPQVVEYYSKVNAAINRLKLVFEDSSKIGRKMTGADWEGRFNRVLFETQIYFFMNISDRQITTTSRETFLAEFKRLCTEDTAFRSSIESTTKSIENYKNRFQPFSIAFNKSFACKILAPKCFQ
jgi:hypothetical protein